MVLCAKCYAATSHSGKLNELFGKPEQLDATELLRDLVQALDGAFISSWQSTASWEKQLSVARDFLNTHQADDAEGRHD